MDKPPVTLIALLLLGGLAVEAGAATIRRAAPPVKWEKLVESQFNADAFSLLEGERPKDFGGPRGGGGGGDEAGKLAEGGKAAAKESGDGPVGNGDFDRRDMMKKLEGAENSLAELMASEKSFKAGGSRIDQTTDLVIMMGKTLFSNDPDYSDDDTYLKHAEDMKNYATQLKNLAKREDYAGAGSVFGKMRTTCNACHEGYR